MRRDEIRVSPKYGVNPSMEVCFVCGNDTGAILLLGMLAGDKEAPRHCTIGNVCDECKEYMTNGVFLIEVTGTMKAHERTGRYVCVRDEAVRRMFPSLAEKMIEKRIAYIEREVFDKFMSE